MALQPLNPASSIAAEPYAVVAPADTALPAYSPHLRTESIESYADPEAVSSRGFCDCVIEAFSAFWASLSRLFSSLFGCHQETITHHANEPLIPPSPNNHAISEPIPATLSPPGIESSPNNASMAPTNTLAVQTQVPLTEPPPEDLLKQKFVAFVKNEVIAFLDLICKKLEETINLNILSAKIFIRFPDATVHPITFPVDEFTFQDSSSHVHQSKLPQRWYQDIQNEINSILPLIDSFNGDYRDFFTSMQVLICSHYYKEFDPNRDPNKHSYMTRFVIKELSATPNEDDVVAFHEETTQYPANEKQTYTPQDAADRIRHELYERGFGIFDSDIIGISLRPENFGYFDHALPPTIPLDAIAEVSAVPPLDETTEWVDDQLVEVAGDAVIL